MFSKVPDFVHLNLSIALLLGLIVFVSGIETATRYRVRQYTYECMYLPPTLNFHRLAALL